MAIHPYTQRLIVRYMPAAFLLLACIVCLSLPFMAAPLNNGSYWEGMVVVMLLAICMRIYLHIERFQAAAAEEAFLISLLLSGASYFLPTVLFLFPIVWGVLAFRVEFVLRTLSASLLGILAASGVIATAIYFGWIDNRWIYFFNPKYQWGWIPVGICCLMWITSTILQKTLHVR